MANVKPYEPDEFANAAVGTPGVNEAAGAAQRMLARGVGQIRASAAQADAQLMENQARTQSHLNEAGARAIGSAMQAEVAAAGDKVQNIGNFFGAANAVAGLIGKGIQSYRNSKAQHKSMLGNIEAANAIYDYELAAMNKRSSLEQKYIDDPQGGTTELNNFLDTSRDAIFEKYADNPGALGKVTGAINQINIAQRGKWETWADGRRTKLAGMRVDKAYDEAELTINGLAGSFDDRMTKLKEVQLNVNNRLIAQQPELGAEAIDAKRLAGNRRMNVAFFRNLISDLPDDAEERMNRIGDAKLILGNAQAFGIPMDDADRDAIMKHYDARLNDAEKDFTDYLVSNEMDTKIKLKGYLESTEIQATNEAAQQTAVDYATKEMVNILAKQDALMADPRKSPAVKKAIENQHSSLLTTLGTLRETGARNLKAMADAKQKGEDDKFAKEQRLATSALNAMKEEVEFYYRTGDSDALIDVGKRMTAQATEAEKKNLISPAQAHSARVLAMRLTSKQGQDDFDKQKKEYLAGWNRMQVELDRLHRGDPRVNMPLIDVLGKQMYAYAEKGEAEGLLTSTQAKEGLIKAQAVVASAHQWKQGNTWELPGGFSIPIPTLPGSSPPLKKETLAKAAAQKQQALNTINGIVTQNRNDQRNQQVNKAYGVNHDAFKAKMDKWLEARRNAGLGEPSPALMRDMEAKLRVKVREEQTPAAKPQQATKPTTKAAAPAKSKNGLVPPPPPDVAINMIPPGYMPAGMVTLTDEQFQRLLDRGK